MKTVVYKLGGTDASFTQVTKVDFTEGRGTHVVVHSDKDGKHEIPIADLVHID